jgi:hypothetical protein
VFLGSVCDALSKLDVSTDKLAYFTAADSAAVTTLTAFGRLLIAADDDAAARTLLSALNKAGDTMSGDLAMATHRVTGLGTPSLSSDAATKGYVDALATLVSGALVFKGSWDASAGTLPGAGAAQTGWFYKVSVAGTVNGQFFSVGDDVFALVNNASTATYAANWLAIQGTLTLAEVQAAVGFTFGGLAALSAVTASLISDASANGRSLITAADYAAMRGLLGLATTDSPTFAGLLLNGLLKFAGATSSFPAIKRNAAKLQARLADDSNFTSIEVATKSANDNSNDAASTAYVDAAVAGASGGLVAGTIMIFRQTSAPTGWTKITTTNDAGLRVVSGTVGAVTAGTAFSTVFSQTSTGNVSLTAAQQANMTVSGSCSGSGSVSGTFSGSASIPKCSFGDGSQAEVGMVDNGSVARSPTSVGVSGSISGTASISGSISGTASGGGATGNAHSHTVALNLNYIDVIIASKN